MSTWKRRKRKSGPTWTGSPEATRISSVGRRWSKTPGRRLPRRKRTQNVLRKRPNNGSSKSSLGSGPSAKRRRTKRLNLRTYGGVETARIGFDRETSRLRKGASCPDPATPGDGDGSPDESP